jgi:GRIP domain
LDAMQHPSRKNNEPVVANSDADVPIAPPAEEQRLSVDNVQENSILSTNMPQISCNATHDDNSSNLMDIASSIKEETIILDSKENFAEDVVEPPLQIADEVVTTVSSTAVEIGTATASSEQKSVTLDPPIVVENDAPMVPSTVMADDEDDDTSSSAVFPVESDMASSGTYIATGASHNNVPDALPQNEAELDANVTELETSVVTASSHATSVQEKESVLPIATEVETAKETEGSSSNDFPRGRSPPDDDGAKDASRNSHNASTSADAHLLLTPSPRKPRWTKKLLILISTNSIDRQVKVRQDLVQTALTAAGIDFECLDGSVSDSDESIQLRNELFTLSGLRGAYPQFFLVDLVNGGTTFWGTFTEFQHANDDGQLKIVFGSDCPAKNLEDTMTLSTSLNSDCCTKIESQQSKSSTGVPDDVLEGFSNQIKRIEENYQIERDETEQRHSIEIEKLTSMYNACVQAKMELEERLQLDIKAKEDQLKEAFRRNEGHRLKLDVLKREVSGTQELLQTRELEMKKLNEKHLHDLRAIEKHGVVAERKAEKLEEELQKVQNSLQMTQDEFNALKGDHETLVQRAKSIAAELKDRRVECRHLESLVDQESQKNQDLLQTIDSLEERLNHQGMSQTEKDSEMDQLRAQLADAKLEMEQVEKVWREKEAKSDLILTEYKKRAQHSLSMANSRTASAVQAREEAELDARSARSTADAALDRANKAEIASREAVLEAKTRIEAMTKERDAAIASLDRLKDEVISIELQRSNAQLELESFRTSKEKTDLEVERLRKELDVAENKTLSTQRKLIESTNLVDTLREEISLLRDQLHHATIHAAEYVAPTEKADSNEYADSKYKPPSMNGSHDEGVDSAIAALRSELNEANDAIEDLKAALKNALEQNDQKPEHQSSNVSTSSESIPLFYAMEKQAELKTARAEMNRLASVIADVQSEKMEAYEAMEDMRRKMEDAEARLKRYEKLGMVPTSETRKTTEHEVNTAVNIEYLKHIMLRFMNAKSMTEKKTLVPVIAAVLELTPDEAQTAMSSIDHNPTTGVVGSSLFGFRS